MGGFPLAWWFSARFAGFRLSFLILSLYVFLPYIKGRAPFYFVVHLFSEKTQIFVSFFFLSALPSRRGIPASSLHPVGKQTADAGSRFLFVYCCIQNILIYSRIPAVRCPLSFPGAEEPLCKPVFAHRFSLSAVQHLSTRAGWSRIWRVYRPEKERFCISADKHRRGPH